MMIQQLIAENLGSVPRTFWMASNGLYTTPGPWGYMNCVLSLQAPVRVDTK